MPSNPRSRRALEIVGVVAAFFYFWPVAAAYLVWKFSGYPVPEGWARMAGRGFPNPFGDARWNASSFGGTGNLAFDEYRRSEIERLEAERRKLDDEARAFRDFVEELKRAKDRQEFDAFMARRNGATSV
jgi:hypothetical protein